MFEDIKRLSTRHKNNKLMYYIRGYMLQLLPSFFRQKQLKRRLLSLNRFDRSAIMKRVNYYNKLENLSHLPETALALKDFKRPSKKKVYFFDTVEFTRFFPSSYRMCTLFGDITHVPDVPSLTKSRPITGENANSVILKLCKIRHFMFVNDTYRFEDKKNQLIGRSKAVQEHRIRFLDMYIDHPMCNVGQVNRDRNPQFIRSRVTLDEHLRYKFILCLEGHDVASNLKWVMSSHSIAVMTVPKYETWFMEGTLIPNYHYICIKDDFSDLEERLNYYINHTEEALEIIKHANEYTQQFRIKKQEDLISLLVLHKYFEKTGQLG